MHKLKKKQVPMQTVQRKITRRLLNYTSAIQVNKT